MGKTLYLDCSGGISGDMMVGMLLDLGADEQKLKETLKTVPADGFEIKISKVKKAGIECTDFDVVLDKEHENHDHDMEYLYGHEHDHDHEHHDHEHYHDHEHPDHHHDHEHHHHEHRSLKDVYDVIDKTKMSDNARKLAKKIFDIVAEAESKAHGLPVSEVHFHEVGAIDSVVDIISIAVCFDDLGISDVVVPKLSEGQGTVRCQHGILPIPVPAVANIASAHKLPLEITNIKGELVTPTGAAVVAALVTSFKVPGTMTIDKIGYGAGKREYETAGFLRGMFINI